MPYNIYGDGDRIVTMGYCDVTSPYAYEDTS